MVLWYCDETQKPDFLTNVKYLITNLALNCFSILSTNNEGLPFLDINFATQIEKLAVCAAEKNFATKNVRGSNNKMHKTVRLSTSNLQKFARLE